MAQNAPRGEVVRYPIGHFDIYVGEAFERAVSRPGRVPASGCSRRARRRSPRSRMAWNVVIAGGGFGGFYTARTLEQVLPAQSARVTLVSEDNFMLYTPLLPGAAAGTLEPRHVVVPLREELRRTDLQLGARRRGRPRPQRPADLPHGRRARGAALRPARRRARLGLAAPADPRPRRARHRVPHAVGGDRAAQRRAADARDRRDDRRSGRSAAPGSRTSSSAPGTPGSRGSPSCRTSPPT